MTLNEHCTVRNHASGFQRLGRCLDPFILFGWIGSLCFADSLLRSFEMPSSLVELRGGVFNNCHMTSERFISQDYAYVVCGCLLLNRDVNVCYGSVCCVMEIVIPSDVVELWDKCFSECRNLERVTFEIHCLGCIFTSSTKLERIGSLAFSETSIDSISIPESVVEVCDRCFYRCSRLRCVTLGASSKLERIGACAFYETNKKFAFTLLLVRRLLLSVQMSLCKFAAQVLKTNGCNHFDECASSRCIRARCWARTQSIHGK